MSAENEKINNESTDATAPAEHNIIDDAISKINTEFPLSGGETNEDLEKVEQTFVQPASETTTEATAISPDSPEHPDHPEHHNWLQRTIEKVEHMIDNLDSDFPLSGGEE